MINSITYRGPLDSEKIEVMHEFSPDDWIGEIVKIPHPESGHMGPSMGKVVDTDTSTGKRRIHPEVRDGDDNEYETVEYTILIIKDLIIGSTHRTHQLGHPQAALVESGSTYSVYGYEKKTEDGEWEQGEFTNGGKWGHNKYSVETAMENATEPEKQTRVIERSVTYRRKEDADPSDAEAYKLTMTTHPVTVERNNTEEPTEQ